MTISDAFLTFILINLLLTCVYYASIACFLIACPFADIRGSTDNPCSPPPQDVMMMLMRTPGQFYVHGTTAYIVRTYVCLYCNDNHNENLHIILFIDVLPLEIGLVVRVGKLGS